MLGGLSPVELLRRTIRESWEDSVFGQGSRMAFYHFLAIFPSLLVLLAISARIPSLGAHTQDALRDLSAQVLPDQVSQLFQNIMGQMNGRALSGWRLVSVCAGALWAALNGTWAMTYGLNRAYEVKECRPKWRLGITIAALTFSLALIGAAAVMLIFLGAHWGAGGRGVRALEWLVLAAALYSWFALLYRFAPNVRDQRWRWSTPGALCAVLLWIGVSFASRVYFERVDSYGRSYGALNGVAMLLLWLYVTNGAILIGGEMNSEIKKATNTDQSLRK